MDIDKFWFNSNKNRSVDPIFAVCNRTGDQIWGVGKDIVQKETSMVYYRNALDATSKEWVSGKKIDQ